MAIIKAGTNHNKMSKLQEDILLEFCNESSLTKTDLKNRLEKHYPDINDSVKVLIAKEYLEKINSKKEKHERGKPKVFYALSLDGIKKILELEIELENFWRLIFHIIKLNRFSSIQIREIFEIHEKNYYKFSKDSVTPLFDTVVSIFNHIKKKDYGYDIYIKILKLLVNEKALTVKEIIIKIDNPKSKISKYYTRNEDNPGLIDMMIKFLLMEKISENSSKYRITSVGTILFFDVLNDELKEKRIEQMELKQLVNNFIMNHREIYPIIFNNWNSLRKIIGDRELISCFSYILNFENLLISGERMQNGGLYEFFNILQSMRRTYSRKLEKNLEVGRKVWTELSNKYIEPEKENNLLTFAMLKHFDKPKRKLSEPTGWDNILNQITDLAIETASIDLKQAKKAGISWYMLNEAFRIQKKRKTLENSITLQFFVLAFYQIRIKQNILRFILKQKNESDIKKDLEKNNNEWELFLDDNKHYMKLFKQQISQIVSFENENIRLIDKLGDFDMESQDSKERDIEFLRYIIQNKSE